jgi:hypothetical protein
MLNVKMNHKKRMDLLFSLLFLSLCFSCFLQPTFARGGQQHTSGQSLSLSLYVFFGWLLGNCRKRKEMESLGISDSSLILTFERLKLKSTQTSRSLKIIIPFFVLNRVWK